MNANVKQELVLSPSPNGAVTPLEMLQTAIDRGLDAGTLTQLMELQREYKADKAREAFVEAMNAFRAEAVAVVKRKVVSFDSTSYKHATLAHLVDAASPKLSEHGLSHRWETKQEGPAITVRCIVTHRLGHSEFAELTAAPDTSGKKNAIQAIGSTVTYLQRYTFTAITGLAAKDQDDDGQGSEGVTLATEEQLYALEERIKAVCPSRPTFLRWLKVETLEGLPLKDHERAMKQLDMLAKNKR